MAQFTTGIGQTDDLKKVQDYLYKLNKDLEYMFSHLTPEDNYSEPAYTKYLQDGEKVTQIETSVDGLKVLVKDNETNYNTSLRLMAGYLGLTASTPAGESSVVVSGDRIQLTTGNFIINAANGGKTTFAVDRYGNATFGGSLQAAGGTFGAVTIGGQNNTGSITVLDANNNPIGRWDKTGLDGVYIKGSVEISCGDQFRIYSPDYTQSATFEFGSFTIERADRGSYSGLYCLSGNASDSRANLNLWEDGIIQGDEIYLYGGGWWNGWSLTRTVQALWDCVEDNVADPSDYDPD